MKSFGPHWLLLSVALFLTCFGILHGPVVGQDTGMVNLRSDFSTGRLDPFLARQVRSSFESASASLTVMKTSHTRVPQEFAHSVNEAVEVFNDAADRMSTGGRLEQSDANKLDEAAADLRTKADWFKHGRSGDPVVTVTVNTKDKKGKATSGFEVWYVTSFYQDVPERAEKFDELSTPTSQNLMPGAYVMWTMAASKKGAVKPVKVGANGATEMSVDLPVPR